MDLLTSHVWSREGDTTTILGQNVFTQNTCLERDRRPPGKAAMR